MNSLRPRREIAAVTGFTSLYYLLLLVALSLDWQPIALPGYLVLGPVGVVAAVLGRRQGALAVVLVGGYVLFASLEPGITLGLWVGSEFLLAPLFIATYVAIVNGARLLIVTAVLAVPMVNIAVPWRSLLDVIYLRDGDAFVGLMKGASDRSQNLILLAVAALTVWLAITRRREQTATRTLLERNAELQRLRDGEAIRVVAEERAAIARDIHDEVAHHIAALVVRAQAAIRVAEGRPDELLAAVRQVVSSGQEALGAMRQVVRVLRVPVRDAAAGARSATSAIDAVVARVGGTGLQIASEIHLDADLEPALGDVVLRTVQEALTNVLLHSGASSARLVVRSDDSLVELDISDPGPAVERFAESLGGGTGLQAMIERVRILNGTMVSGPTSDGGWRVHAVLPLSSGRPPTLLPPGGSAADAPAPSSYDRTKSRAIR